MSIQVNQLHKLQMVYHPVSNQEAEWLRSDQEFKDRMAASNLYMITQHPQVKFMFNDDPLENIKNGNLKGIMTDGEIESEFEIDLISITNYYETEIELETADKIIRVIKEDDHSLIAWFTPESLAFCRSHNYEYVKGLEEYKHFLSFKLHYIGLSKKDSFTRLILNPHDTRTKILSNEQPMRSGSRVTDELYLLFFQIPTLEIKTYEYNQVDELMNNFGNITGTKHEIIADAEKALISVLKPEYNGVLYKEYPVSVNGLFNHELDGYMFYIGESITLHTEAEAIRGNYNLTELGLGNTCDCIAVKEKQITYFKID